MSTDFGYPSKLSEALNDLRKRNQLCDIIINVHGRAFHAHKAVLAAASSYFLAMFTSGFKESTQSEVEIEGKAEIFEILLEFAYTGELKITSETAYDVLDMVCYMQFTNIYLAYCNFIDEKFESRTSKIPMGSMFKIAQLATNHEGLKEVVVDVLLKYMEKNVQELKVTDEFLQNADVAFLEEFLSLEDLSSAEEEKQVLEMVVTWLKYDWENRRNHSLRLLQKVRLGFVPTTDLKELIDSEIQKVPECKALLDSVLRLQSSKKAVTSLSEKHPKLYATRSTVTVPMSSSSEIDDSGESMCSFHYYHPRDHLWKRLGKLPSLPPEVSNFHSLITVKNKLYVAGGCRDQDPNLRSLYGFDFRIQPVCEKKFFRYHEEKNEWTRLPSMKKARQKFSLVFLDGFIYAIAGTNQEGDFMRDVERYDMSKRKWQVLASLPEGYRWVSAIAYRGKILLYGMSAIETDVSDDSPRRGEHVIQVYHPDTDRWQTVLSEEQEIPTTSSLPALFIHTDVCYRVLYHTTEDASGRSSWMLGSGKPEKPLVNILEVQFQDDQTTVTVGEEVNQDHIPPNKIGGFRINNEVFVNSMGFIYKTDLEISPDQKVEVNFSRWYGFRNEYALSSNITCFTFDRKKLEVEEDSDTDGLY